MRDFHIITDTCCDLKKQTADELGITVLPFSVTHDNVEFKATLDWSTYAPKQYYDMMRSGTHFKSSQINADTYFNEFERVIKEGKDVLLLSTSSGLSGSINSARIAAGEIAEKYSDAKVICVDCLRGSLGQGLLIMEAVRQKNGGASITDIAEWVESNRDSVNQIGTVDDLQYLKRAGRVTGAAALMGDIFRIKPLLISNSKGQNVSVGKAIGRNVSLRKIIAYVKDSITDKNQLVGIVHADCSEDADKLADLLKSEVGIKNVYINYVGATIGASVGPGMLGVYYFGKKITT